MLVTIGKYFNPLEAYIAQGRLEAEGFEVIIDHEHHVWADWPITMALGGVKLQVSAEVANEALKTLNKLNAGEYKLIDEDDSNPISLCPKCGCNKYKEARLRWKISLVTTVLVYVPIPYSVFRVKCDECGYKWTQRDLRAYPLWYAAIIPFLMFVVVFVLYEMFYYACKINYWSPECI